MFHAHTKHNDSLAGLDNGRLSMSKGIFVIIWVSVRCDKSVQTKWNNVCSIQVNAIDIWMSVAFVFLEISDPNI